ncbi:cation-transporting P-type ATPase, partial [Candidatus Bathyarchaeota archaeon]|nr:cation-transporting P-type ATPase [Candidatus Bathyarchaeota archaeon]
VSAIPEGLPAVLTITLALGTARMARQKAIIRKLASVETLGSTTVICSDKTGTLTKNEMTVQRLTSNGRTIHVTGAGYAPEGEFESSGTKFDPRGDTDLELLLRIGALNNDAHVQEDGGIWMCFGDPTEGALTVTAEKAGMSHSELNKAYPRVAELPFDSARKRMSTLHRTPEGKLVAYVKGAPEIILERSVSIFDGQVRPIQQDDVDVNMETMTNMAEDALRVLAMAYKELPDDYDIQNLDVEAVESNLTFVGMMGMIDPAREEVPLAIQTAHSAGIRSVMVTGDHRITAVAIAKEIGILREEDEAAVLTGADLEGASDEQLDEIIETVRVFAR